ncbi:MAG: mannonate dehydratase [Halanaerobiales bacterium]
MKKELRIAGGQLRSYDSETLTMVKQLGVDSIQFNTPDLPGEKYWDYEALLNLKQDCEEHGLYLECIENVPLNFYNKIMLGLPGKEEQMENMKKTVRNIGKAGIPVFGYHFEPAFVWRTSHKKGRGDASVTSFNLQEAEEKGNLIDFSSSDVKISESALWENYEYFINNIIPVAEEAGVRLALHPADPPLSTIDGYGRLFYKFDNFKRAMEMAGSDVWGLDLCLGCVSEMPAAEEEVMKMIDYFGSRGKIFYIHFRDVQGTVPDFKECFIGEGNYNPAAVIIKLKEIGFDGFLISDHVPQIVNDTEWGHRARAHAIGYMQGLLKMAERLS